LVLRPFPSHIIAAPTLVALQNTRKLVCSSIAGEFAF
jgi:hypothetical protein